MSRHRDRVLSSVITVAVALLVGAYLPGCGDVRECDEKDTALEELHVEFDRAEDPIEEEIEEVVEITPSKAPVPSDGPPLPEDSGRPIDSPASFEEEQVKDVIGVGGGAGRRFGGKYRVRGKARGGGRMTARPSAPPPSSGGTHNVNNEAYDLQFFKSYGVNPFVDTDDDPLSTFAVDVDTGAYTICRRFIGEGNRPKKAAVRVEEFVNYFDYTYAPPAQETFATYVEGAPSPFAANRTLLAIGIQGKQIDAAERKDAVLTFVIDTSGSMNRNNRLGLVKQALGLLVDQLRPSDQIGIAVYGSSGKKILGHTPLTEGKSVILEAINALDAGGSTNAEEGLRIGYEMAAKAFREGCNNRVVLCSDGVANTGNTGVDALFEMIRAHVEKGVCLTTVGFGMDNYNDVLLERLGDKGNGHYAYIDTLDEARRIFVTGLTGTLQVIARDVKVQLELNPRRVRSYRLVGYENRDVADKDFRNNLVDGGEVGAEHAVTALYELKMWDDAEEDEQESPLATLRIRFEDPDHSAKVTELEIAIEADCLRSGLSEASANYRLAACVATFAEVLRGSYWAKHLSFAGAAEEARALALALPGDAKVGELDALIAKAALLVEAQEQARALQDTPTPTEPAAPESSAAEARPGIRDGK